MIEKVKILTEEGNYITLDQWQKSYGLKGYNIGKYFSLKETRFKKDIELFGELIVCEPLMILLDAFRKEIGKPIYINSFNRSEVYQKTLAEKGFKAAKTSPHVVKMAADIDTVSDEQTRLYAKKMREVSKKIGIKCRIGFRQYIAKGDSFIHVDVCPVYYGKGCAFESNEVPSVWRKEIEW